MRLYFQHSFVFSNAKLVIRSISTNLLHQNLRNVNCKANMSKNYVLWISPWQLIISSANWKLSHACWKQETMEYILSKLDHSIIHHKPVKSTFTIPKLKRQQFPKPGRLYIFATDYTWNDMPMLQTT